MKNVLIAFLTIYLISCSSYKIATVSSNNANLKPEGFVFENDTVQIIYKFWGNSGRMAFDIYNKIDKPLFFDWKNSAYIPNDRRNSYWKDETSTIGVYSVGPYGTSSSKSNSVKQDRVSIIPPHSKITNNRYSLVSDNYPLNIGKKTEINFDINTTPLKFRNFLAVSIDEQFLNNVFYVDNSFFVSAIKKVTGNSKLQVEKSNGAFYTSY